MCYASFLRSRASECVRLAVETAGEEGTDALIELAQDYSSWADAVELNHYGFRLLSEQEYLRPTVTGTAVEQREVAPAGFRRLFSWAAR